MKVPGALLYWQVVKYIDIPLQHLSSSVLQRMQRPGAGATLSLLERLRAQIPNLALRTTFISGFPGETEEEHRTLVREVSVGCRAGAKRTAAGYLRAGTVVAIVWFGHQSFLCYTPI